MNAARFDLGAYPRVAARQARAVRAALPSLVALPRRWEVALPSLGLASVTFSGLETARAVSSVHAFGVVRGIDAGRMTVDSMFGCRLVDVALGGPAVFRSARALGPAARGVLAGLLGAVFEQTGWAIHLGSARAPTGDPVTLVFRLETTAGAGDVRLDLPKSVAPADARVEIARRAARIPVTLRAEIASTKLRAVAAATLAPGDAVVFDGIRAEAFAQGASWRATLAFGGGRAACSLPILIDAHGAMTVVGGLEVHKQERQMDDSGSTDAATDATAVLASAPIEVVAELGRITLRGDELLGLSPGAVFALGAGREAVSLRIAGELWATGEIVDVEGELGVRVTRVIRL